MQSLPEKNIMRVALIGFMGCGKTSIGRILASRLNVRFVDLDKEIEAFCDQTIAEIFSRQGESGFRTLEENRLAAVAGDENPVILACGGGIVLSPANRTLLQRDFSTIWIDVPFAELIRRLATERKKRPLLHADDYESRAEKLFLARQPMYEAAAQFIVRWEKGESIGASAMKIAGILGIDKA